MKTLITVSLATLLITSCCKKVQDQTCNIEQTYAENAAKVTITNGIWGTVHFQEGNCMPGLAPSTCKDCPVQRTIRIYQYTTVSDVTPSPGSPSFFDGFNTQLIKEFSTDENGFFQVSIPNGKFTIVTIENGRLYSNYSDDQGGLSPITFNGGKENINLAINYNAAF